VYISRNQRGTGQCDGGQPKVSQLINRAYGSDRQGPTLADASGVTGSIVHDIQLPCAVRVQTCEGRERRCIRTSRGRAVEAVAAFVIRRTIAGGEDLADIRQRTRRAVVQSYIDIIER